MAQEQCQKKKNGNGETGANNNDDGDDCHESHATTTVCGFGGRLANLGRRLLVSAFGSGNASDACNASAAGRRDEPGLISHRGFGFGVLGRGSIPLGAVVSGNGQVMALDTMDMIIKDTVNKNKTGTGNDKPDAGVTAAIGMVDTVNNKTDTDIDATQEDNQHQLSSDDAPTYTPRPNTKPNTDKPAASPDSVSDDTTDCTASTTTASSSGSDSEGGDDDPVPLEEDEATIETEETKSERLFESSSFSTFSDLARLLLHPTSHEPVVVVHTTRDLKRLKTIMTKALSTQPELQRVLSTSPLVRELQDIHFQSGGQSDCCTKAQGCRCENCQDPQGVVVKALVDDFLNVFVRVAAAGASAETSDPGNDAGVDTTAETAATVAASN